MYTPIEDTHPLGTRNAVDGDAAVTVLYWGGEDGFLADPQIIVTTLAGEFSFKLPGPICRHEADHAPTQAERTTTSLERIAAALEALNSKLDGLTSGAGNLKVVLDS